jgi:hypothetical protein
MEMGFERLKHGNIRIAMLHVLQIAYACQTPFSEALPVIRPCSSLADQAL